MTNAIFYTINNDIFLLWVSKYFNSTLLFLDTLLSMHYKIVIIQSLILNDELVKFHNGKKGWIIIIQ